METAFDYRLSPKQRLYIGLLMQEARHVQRAWLCRTMISMVNEWMVEAIDDLYASNMTLFFALSMLYRFLIKFPSMPDRIMLIYYRKQLQLMAVTCIFICSKLHERTHSVRTPRHYASTLTAGTYREEELLEMEEKILRHVQYFIYPPGYVNLAVLEEEENRVIQAGTHLRLA